MLRVMTWKRGSGIQSAADNGAIGLSTQCWIDLNGLKPFYVTGTAEQSHFDQAVALLTSVDQSAALSAAEVARISAVSLTAIADAVGQ